MWISAELRALLSPFPIYFNSIDLTAWIFPKQDTGRGLMEREHSIVTVPGRSGGFINQLSTPVRYISQEVLIACDNAQELRKKLEELNAILHTEEPVPLIFGDELDRTYYALYAGASEGYQLDGFYTATIEFVCPDPFKYGSEKTLPFSNGAVTIRNAGTVPTKPVIEALVNEPITYMDVYNDKGYMRIGEPVDAGNSAQRELEWVLNDSASSLVGWSSASWVPDGGVKAGVLKTSGDVFYTDNYGAGDRWHGPAMSKSLTSTATDFKVRATFVLEVTDGKAKGRSEIYLLDTLGGIIGKLAVVTNSGRDITIEVNLRSGVKSHYMVVERNFRKGLFNGHVILTKKGTGFSVELGVQDLKTFKVLKRYKIVYRDVMNEYQSTLAAVGVHLGAFGTYPTPKYNRIRGIFVQKINQITGTPYIAEAGDIITLDFNNSTIFINDEERKELKDFGSTFFSIPTGQTTLLLEPESLTGELRYREVFR